MLEKMSWKSKSLLAIIATAFAGCAALEPPTPEKAVEARAMQYWKTRIEARIDQAYLLTSPSYRAARTADQYKARFGSSAAITKAEVVNVACEATKCSARMKLTASVALPMVNLKEIVTYVEEPWILEDGSWWRYEEL